MGELQKDRLNVGIIDYGLGNLFSVQRAVNKAGGNGIITYDPDIIQSCDKLILPGVGAFADGMKGLKDRSLLKPIYYSIEKNISILGICLGMQLLMTSSEEFGITQGLDIIKGKVIKFSKPILGRGSFKVPHIGWNQLLIPKNKPEGNNKIEGVFNKSILRSIKEKSFVYFVHSYFVLPENQEYVLAETFYGEDKYCSAVFDGNVIGCQFHPERSGAVGIEMYKNFLFSS